MPPTTKRYRLFNPDGFQRGPFFTDAPSGLGSSQIDADLRSCLLEEGAQPGQRWYAILDDEHGPGMLWFLTLTTDGITVS